MSNKIGWFNKNKLGNSPKYESYRHSLASKGIKTNAPKSPKGFSSSSVSTPNFDMVAKGKVLQWKKNLSAVMDNPDYIEEQMKAINIELSKETPRTSYLRQKMNSMLKWADEIDLAQRRASQKTNKKTDMISGKKDYIDSIMGFEDGTSSDAENLKLFSKLIKSGVVWNLQGVYGRTAKELIDRGLISSKGTILKNKKTDMDMRIKGYKNTSKTFSDGSKSIEWRSKFKKVSIDKDLFNGAWNVAVTSLRRNEVPQLMADTNHTKEEAFKIATDYMKKVKN